MMKIKSIFSIRVNPTSRQGWAK